MKDYPRLDDPDFCAGDPFPVYAALRREAPLAWQAEGEFWAALRHAEVVAVSRDPAAFCSSRGVLFSDAKREITARESILYMDPPDHVKYRKLVQPAFTPGQLRALEATIREIARRLASEIEPGAVIDFVERFAAPLPMLVIAEMLGVPGEDRDRFKRWSDAVIEAATEQTPENMTQTVELLNYFSEVIARRRETPGDDLISVLTRAEVDGERLEEMDLLMFCLTLLVAGNETTRNLLSHGALALAHEPEQLQKLLASAGSTESATDGGTLSFARLPDAIEEMLRFGSPISSFLRTATRDVELAGQQIRAGQRILLLYASANRDEAVFGEDAERFRIDRDASRHVAFGFGEHFCLGAALARTEARIALEELLTRFSGIELAGPPKRLRSVLMRGIEQLPLALHARAH